MQKQSIYIFLSVAILLQSCVVYQKTSVSLAQSYDRGKGKIIYKTGDEVKFKNINKTDGIYKIVDKSKIKNDAGKYVWVERTIPLDSATVTSIFLKDKKKSKRRTTLLVVVAIPLGILIGLGLIGGALLW